VANRIAGGLKKLSNNPILTTNVKKQPPDFVKSWLSTEAEACHDEFQEKAKFLREYVTGLGNRFDHFYSSGKSERLNVQDNRLTLSMKIFAK
jgi:hypothetical protein